MHEYSGNVFRLLSALMLFAVTLVWLSVLHNADLNLSRMPESMHGKLWASWETRSIGD